MSFKKSIESVRDTGIARVEQGWSSLEQLTKADKLRLGIYARFKKVLMQEVTGDHHSA
jgi:hypothetical protein